MVFNQRSYNTKMDYFIAGGLAGVANSIVSSPMEHIRIRIQI